MTITPAFLEFKWCRRTSMPVRRQPPHKTQVRNLLASKKLTAAERTAFEKMLAKFKAGNELNDHEKLWIETLNARYLARKD